jgi:hypothetical protein
LKTIETYLSFGPWKKTLMVMDWWYDLIREGICTVNLMGLVTNWGFRDSRHFLITLLGVKSTDNKVQGKWPLELLDQSYLGWGVVAFWFDASGAGEGGENLGIVIPKFW